MAKKLKKLPKWAIKQAGGINKKAWALARRGRKTSSRSPKKATRKRKSSPRRSNPKGGTTTNNNKSPKIGASYTHGKQGLAVVSPVTDKGLRAVSLGAGVEEWKSSGVQLETQARANPQAWLSHAVTVGLDGMVDAKMRQANALSRNSITAWLPEGYMWFRGFEGWKRGGNIADSFRQSQREMSIAYTGFDPAPINHQLSAPAHRMYRLLKHLGQGGRLLRSKVKLVKRVTDPLSKLLGMFKLSI